MSILLPPGNYTVKLLVGGRELSQPLIVKKDPNSTGTEADIAAQNEMLSELRRNLDTAADMINQIEIIRSQLNSITTILTARTDSSASDGSGGSDSSTQYADLKSAANTLDAKLVEIEDDLIQRKLTGQGQDSVRWPPKLLTKINYLASGLAGADFGPTNQQREVHAQFKQQLATLRNRLDEVLSRDVSAFNRRLQENRIQNVITSTR
jgi:DNA repair exonuclease SbcCD ATPase subunit